MLNEFLVIYKVKYLDGILTRRPSFALQTNENQMAKSHWHMCGGT